MPATLKNKKKTVSRTKPRVVVEWAVYEVDDNDEPLGEPTTHTSRAEARAERKDCEARFPSKFGVFRRVVSETRD